jgi:hypothetical protein
MTRKGYLGPIGDDFSSLFPIMFGLLIFFSALTMTYDTYQVKKDWSEVMRANLVISRAVRSQVVFNEDIFKDGCQKLVGIKSGYGVKAGMELVGYPRFKCSGADDVGDIPGGSTYVAMDYLVAYKRGIYVYVPNTKDYEGFTENVPAILKIHTWRV